MMKCCVALVLCLLLGTVATLRAAEPLPPIEKVEVGPNREFLVNGKPFFPIMLWVQSDARIPDGLKAGVNTFCANGGNLTRKGYLDKLGENGLYGIVHFGDDHADVVGHPRLLGWIHGDEPDMDRKVSDATVQPRKGMKINEKTPFSRLVDGALNSWTVIDPLATGEMSVKLNQAATAESVAVAVTVSGEMPVAKDVVFLADGKEILKATLEKKRGGQKFALPQPVTFKELTLKVTSAHAGEGEWGSLGEIQAFDKDGKNVLLSVPRLAPRTDPADNLALYRRIKQASKRPALVTFTGNFFEKSTKYKDPEMRAKIYPAFVEASDVVGFDIYPVYGSGFASHLDYVADATEELVRLAGPRPVYAWIETNKGSKWMTLSKQPEVEPRFTRCEVWMAIIRGATAIGYFTHRWRPDYKQFAPEGEMLAEMKRIDDQITRLTPAILAPAAKAKVTMTLGDNLPCHLKATAYGGALWIFAENIDLGPEPEKKRQFEPIEPRAGTATITVEGLKAGTVIEVVDEDRTITAGDGKFTDDFPPLREHIYRIPR